MAAFGLPAATGHLVLLDDNLIQNYPLRVLVGEQVRQGHLPLWNPYIWSGTPLLAGYNAGAAFPLTWLFIIMPAKLAWVLTEIVTYAIASFGLYTFLRLYGLRRGASVLGALTFSFAGFMSSQLVHIDLVEGVGLIPWVLVSVRQIMTSAHVAWRWVALLGASLALIVLSGAPEALIDTVIVVAIYGIDILWRNRDRARTILLQLVVGVAAAILLSAAQWLPGLAFTTQSQRGSTTFTFFATGSLPPPLTILALVPYLLGGYGRLGVPYYFGSYNLAEVSSYVGILPLVAALWLLSARFRRHRSARDWSIWYVVVAVSVVLALGTHTPVGNIMFHVPLYNAQRLQNRYLASADLGLAILFAFWVDRVTERPAGVGLPAHWRSRVVPAMPAVGVTISFVLFYAWGTRFVRALGAVDLDPALRGSMKPYMVITLCIALLASAVGCFYDRIPPRRRLHAIALVTAIDIGFFTLYQSWLAFPPQEVVNVTTPDSRLLAQEVGSSRFAIYNPQLYNYDTLLDLGQPDLNIISKLNSSQGYGSIVSASYQEATGSHDQSTLYPVAIKGTTLDELDTTVLLSRLEYFATQLNAPTPTQPPAPPSVTSTITAPPLPPPLPPLGPDQQRTWYFGALAEVSRVRVPLTRPLQASSGFPLRIGIRTADGSVSWPPLASESSNGGMISGRFARPQLSSGLVVQDLASERMEVGAPDVDTQDYGTLRLDGILQRVVQPPHWMYSRMIGAYAVFQNTRAQGPYWLRPSRGSSIRGATARLTSSSTTGAQSFVVRSRRPVELVRSVAFEPGWTAAIGSPGSSRSYGSPVKRAGAIQETLVPAGIHTVTFSYEPASALGGIGISAGTLVAGLSVVIAVAVVRRNRRASARHPDKAERSA